MAFEAVWFCLVAFDPSDPGVPASASAYVMGGDDVVAGFAHLQVIHPVLVLELIGQAVEKGGFFVFRWRLQIWVQGRDEKKDGWIDLGGLSWQTSACSPSIVKEKRKASSQEVMCTA